MHIGDLRGHIVRREGFDPSNQRRKVTDQGKQYSTNNIEHQMNNRGALGVAVGADGGQHRRNTGPDILPEKDVNRAGQTDKASASISSSTVNFLNISFAPEFFP